MADLFKDVSPEQRAEMDAMLTKAASNDPQEAAFYRAQVAKAIELPLRPGVLSGDILGDIYENIVIKPGTEPKFPLHFLAPGTEKEFVAYTVPNHGRIPERRVEGDYVSLPYYNVAGSIDCVIDYIENARWDVVADMAENLRMQHVKKKNDDGFHTLLAAGVDRNIVVYDSDAASGQFTKRLVSLMKTVMRRNGGGNSSSVNRFKLTDLYISPEANEDMRNWGIDQLDEVSRREVYVAQDGTLNRVYGINLHDMDELGEAQEYQIYYTNSLAGTFPSGDVELVVGLDQSRRRSFVNAQVKPLQVFDDPALHRSNLMGWYSRESVSFGALDNRCIILGSL